MSSKDCSRLWEAEALEDGRLNGADRASFERHAATCDACRRELDDLRALRERLASVAAPPVGELQRRSERSRLLRTASDGKIGSAHGRRGTLIFVLAALLVVAAFGYGRARWTESDLPEPLHADEQPLLPSAPRFDARSSSDAVWLPQTSGATTRVTLTNGSVTFVVPALAPAQRFVVVLPDGEIEVRGASFTAVVERARTVHVSVADRVVALRLDSGEEMLLRTGDVWPAPVAAAATMPPVTSVRPAVGVASAPRENTMTARPTAGALFGEAFASFERGAYDLADIQFERFTREHPDDPRTEDAAYLRAVARFRMGDREGAAALARAYLAAYPSGLRRPEAQRLADGAHEAR